MIRNQLFCDYWDKWNKCLCLFYTFCVIIFWVRIDHRVGYELIESGYETSEPGYESSGYERSLGTKRLVSGNRDSVRQHGLVNRALFSQTSSIVAEGNSLLVCEIGVNATTIISSMKFFYVNCSTILAHLYTRGYSLSSLIFCSWIHLHGFVKRSPNFCTVVSMKLLLAT